MWLERDGEPRPDDDMIAERLALGVYLLEARRHPDSGLDAIVDPHRSTAERAAALAKHRIDPQTRVRVLATPADAPDTGDPSGIVPTRYGLLKATLDRHGTLTPPQPAGIGTWTRADQAPESWDAAVIALRLTDPTTPTVDATDLGAMLLLAQAHDPDNPHQDVRTLATLDQRSADILRTLVEADSIRSAAATLGMHHSTVQARHEALTTTLGYDPRTTTGRMRYIAAALLLRLTDPLTPGRTQSA
ncbi:hypothetical protein [Kitasatospora sp. NPDC015120]|uniref:hypothetical protein n=1 Tax=Kitasatospora sp. NPDC015120 TaxID=3364023 RepID=UPI0036F4972E